MLQKVLTCFLILSTLVHGKGSKGGGRGGKQKTGGKTHALIGGLNVSSVGPDMGVHGLKSGCGHEIKTLGCKQDCPSGWRELDRKGTGCCASFFSCGGWVKTCERMWHCFDHHHGWCKRKQGCMCDGRDSGCHWLLEEGDGDCDSDNDCGHGLYCGTDNCGDYRDLSGFPWASQNGWDKTDDCCYKPAKYAPGSPPPTMPPFYSIGPPGDEKERAFKNPTWQAGRADARRSERFEKGVWERDQKRGRRRAGEAQPTEEAQGEAAGDSIDAVPSKTQKQERGKAVPSKAQKQKRGTTERKGKQLHSKRARQEAARA